MVSISILNEVRAVLLRLKLKQIRQFSNAIKAIENFFFISDNFRGIRTITYIEP